MSSNEEKDAFNKEAASLPLIRGNEPTRVLDIAYVDYFSSSWLARENGLSLMLIQTHSWEGSWKHSAGPTTAYTLESPPS